MFLSRLRLFSLRGRYIVLWSLELASELFFHDFSLIILAGKSRIQPLFTRAEFQKEHGREICALGKEFGIAGERCGVKEFVSGM